MRWEVREYLSHRGDSPFSDWLSNLDPRTRGRIRARINRIRSGNFGNCKRLGSKIWELKLDFGPGYRVYFGRIGRLVVLLLCGGDKSTQTQDINVAEALWKDYERRNEDG